MSYTNRNDSIIKATTQRLQATNIKKKTRNRVVERN